MSRASDFHPGTDPRPHIQIATRLTPEDRALLVKLSHARKQSASDVIRSLIRDAASALPGGE